MTEHLCVTCPQLRQGDPRIYERANVCEGCRARLRSMLAEIVEHHARLDPRKGNRGGERISGSRAAPLPLLVDPLDLAMPPHLAVVYEPPCTCTEPRPECRPGHPHGDQLGETSVATVLESWARDWQSYWWSTLPRPSVGNLAGWLAERLDTACDRHPAIDDFAFELDAVAFKLRPRGARPELKAGVPCRDCERVTLYRWPGSDYIECGTCPAMLTLEEYARWTELISAKEWRSWVVQVVAAQAVVTP